VSEVTNQVSERTEAKSTPDPTGDGKIVTYPTARLDAGQGEESAQRAEVIALHQELALLKQRLRVREDALVKLNQRLRVLEADLAKDMGLAHASLEARVAATSQKSNEDVERLKGELVRRDEDLAAARRELDTLLGTKTFRWTRTVRSLYSRLTPR
jgi:predicted  nucleic acid-binding Zn-ribbon protein